MLAEIPPTGVDAAPAEVGVSRRRYVLAFPCSYELCEGQTPLTNSAASATYVCAAFQRIGFHAAVHSNLCAARIVGVVTGAAQALLSNDVLVLYFCCHGFVDKSRATGHERQYVVTEDGKHVDVADICAVVSQGVTNKNLNNVTLLTLLDCCRSARSRTSVASLLNGHCFRMLTSLLTHQAQPSCCIV